MKRRTFLIGSVSGLSLVALTACVPPSPRPTASVSPSPTPTPSLVPKPENVRRTSWSADPFARGSFSFPAVGATPEQREALATPVDGRLFLAGEATSIDAPGTVQGARASGMRAARDVQAVATAGERIAVIGAGIAGLTAARALKDAGFDVVVVEARDRIGGRIDTVTDKKWPFPIELGASVVRASGTTTLDEELIGLGVITAPFSRTSETRTSDGLVVPVPDTGAQAVNAALAWAADQPADVSVARALADSGASKLSTTDADTGVSDADWLDYEITTVLALNSGAAVDDQSGWYTPAAPGLDEDRLVLGGFNGLFDALLEGIDLLGSSVVTRIAYGESGASLRLGNGESLGADRVIVTVPLGVLKTKVMEFDPPLPFAHRGAIAALGMGTLDKIWLQFAEPFWDTDAPLWTTVGGDDDFRVWINMVPFTGEPVLVGLVAAETALRLAEVGDDEFLAAALASLVPFVSPMDTATPTPAPK
ncbi:FAD-dependent oxidoreductase [Cryobacterium sp. TMT1-21]|uniref:FAD-dependent oxidoreductase n=1 Tax=Cryobacterium shii TaxID=1259235 RepID=A0AAQ2C662_9MICO|nr:MULTISPECIES: NAD(P)/FAD-dependent oxidoreductase [Cryobacterium]TFC46381.1 FAD-dependent oxidoreductase [Cryobacterium shii]TFC89904.1 FAD-dependent oxidoreductase [Cryobacterium sp. TmT2-59]TFD16427.1 FAD-dependent oxidoreductase [Cryobacterium sp. TMT1-21]TFD20725.1 FAD-dependent oxidoreductase [Cryobacterium sp. TMT4-10]TFD42038.1 FAD-dependent oxidoreductase [Cryobacterium sp. TMT2-10]